MTRSRARKRRRFRRAAFLVIVLLLAVGVIFALTRCGGDEKNGEGGGSLLPAKKPEPVELSLLCCGDVMSHSSQTKAQYNSSSGTYDYTNNFEYIKAYVEATDLALCNVETPFAGGTPSGYPQFNAPDELADGLVWAGFDVAITANNHMLDKGLAGVERTLETLHGRGLVTSGSQLSGEVNYALTEVKGVTVGVVSYTYETPRANGYRTINSMYLTDELAPMVNSFGYEDLDGDLAEISQTVDDCRKAGADVIVCYYHWGEEYQREPNSYQQYIAEQTLAMDVDVLFASHPHVLQGVDVLTDEATGKEMPVFYSMGNLLSNQRAETLDNRYTEQGMLACVDLVYTEGDGVDLVSAGVVPTWVDRYPAGAGYRYEIVPLDGNMDSNDALKASGHLSRARQALADVTELVGEEYIRK